MRDAMTKGNRDLFLYRDKVLSKITTVDHGSFDVISYLLVFEANAKSIIGFT